MNQPDQPLIERIAKALAVSRGTDPHGWNNKLTIADARAVIDALMVDHIDPRAHQVFKELEIVIGTDRIVRINIDGLCALRMKLAPDCVHVIRDMNHAGQ